MNIGGVATLLVTASNTLQKKKKTKLKIHVFSILSSILKIFPYNLKFLVVSCNNQIVCLLMN